MRFTPFGNAIKLFPRQFKKVPVLTMSSPSIEETAHPRWAEIWNNGLQPGQAFDAKVPGT
jgi:hypothetical protein